MLLYPSLCLFEGTVISQGRGTHMPFCVLGNPLLKGSFDFSFTPVSMPGRSETPLHMNQIRYGLDLRGTFAFKEQIASGMSEADIRKTWEPGLSFEFQVKPFP